MRKSYPGFYRPTDDEFKKLWDECVFVLDANVLLNLYRYSEKTRRALMSLLDLVKDRLWLPYQAGYEFHKNRLKVISDQEEAYEKLIAIITDAHKKLENDLNAYSKHPLIDSKDIKQKISDELGKIQNELEQAKANHPNVLEKDDVIEFLTSLFENKVGDPYDRERLKKIYENAEKRFKEETPPGYKDLKKPGVEKYGDFVMWQQIIDKAKQDKTSIIFVTDDVKEDWWRQFKGKTLGPRPELIEEIKSEAHVDFYMYQTDPFMEYASSHFNKALNKDAVEEVRMVRDNYIRNFELYSSFTKETEKLRESLIHMQESLKWPTMPNDYYVGNTLLQQWLKDPNFNPYKAHTLKEWLYSDLNKLSTPGTDGSDNQKGENDGDDAEVVN